MPDDARAFRSRFGALGNLLGFPLRQADVRWLHSLNERLAPLDVTAARAAALLFIEHNPGCSQAALGDALRINRASTVSAVDDLERVGAVERRKANGNARNNALYLTEAGQTLHAAIGAEARAHEAAYFAALSGEEREQLRALLIKVLGG
ncbi:MarR family winged helix-turn-helix transcriptional regulator [Sphingomonas sp.]|uniref:MarR family winged helix-turn-helix transcriptional regulator n=1 Tax=Sphingomonas sp. TaxID=28214 RepID=UPI002DD633F9|nr:MarR family winged helix-turn-helix transcriptional regulator [Sphingomonas sp.]